MPQPIKHDLDANVTTLGGRSLVMHCHFYNCALQKAIEEGMGADARDVLRDSAAEPVRTQMLSLVDGDSSRVPEVASAVFRELGFGALDLSQVSRDGGVATVANSHYAMGWMVVEGAREEPACRFVEGFIAGAVAALGGHEVTSVSVVESGCVACGDETCSFTVEVV